MSSKAVFDNQNIVNCIKTRTKQYFKDKRKSKHVVRGSAMMNETDICSE